MARRKTPATGTTRRPPGPKPSADPDQLRVVLTAYCSVSIRRRLLALSRQLVCSQSKIVVDALDAHMTKLERKPPTLNQILRRDQ